MMDAPRSLLTSISSSDRRLDDAPPISRDCWDPWSAYARVVYTEMLCQMIGRGTFSRVYAVGSYVEKRTSEDMAIRDGLIAPLVNELSLGWDVGVHRMRRGTKLRGGVREFVDICLQVYKMHRLGIVHNDLKPQNIVMYRGKPQIIDFGASRYIREAPVREEVSIWYRSPELCTGRTYDLRSDIWSLGCIYYEMMTGKPLYPHDNVYALVRAHHYKPDGFLRHLLAPKDERWDIVQVLAHFGITVEPLLNPLDRESLAAWFRAQLPDHGDGRAAADIAARVMWGEDVDVKHVKYMCRLKLPRM